MTKILYIAGPLFSDAERVYLEMMEDYITNRVNIDKNEIYLPHRDAGDVGLNTDRNTAFEKDIEMIDECDIIIALLDGMNVDSGTAGELGYAYKSDKILLGLLTDRRFRNQKTGELVHINNIIWGFFNKGKNIFPSLRELVEKLKSLL